MDDILQQAIAAILRWPVRRQEEVAAFILALDRLNRPRTPSPFHRFADGSRRDGDALAPPRRLLPPNERRGHVERD